MLKRSEIIERGLRVFILEPYRFPKEVKFPEEVDVENRKVKMWVPRLPAAENLVEGNLFEEIELEELDENSAILKEVEGYLVVLDSEGNVVAESALNENPT